MSNLLVVVDDLDSVSVAVFPDEADAPLVIDPDRVLALPVALERLEAMPRDTRERVQRRSRVEGLKAPLSCRPKSFEGRNAATLREALGLAGTKRSNHVACRLASVTSYVNRNQSALRGGEEDREFVVKLRTAGIRPRGRERARAPRDPRP